VGGNARQQHVARDEHAELGAVQAGVLGRVAEADDDAPGVGADAYFVAVEQAAVVAGHFGRAAAVGVAAGGQGLVALVGQAGAAGLVEHVDDRVARGLGPDRLRGEELALGHVDGGAVARRKPGGQPDVVGVVVGDDDAADRPAVGGEHGVPRVLGVGRGVAAV